MKDYIFYKAEFEFWTCGIIHIPVIILKYTKMYLLSRKQPYNRCTGVNSSVIKKKTIYFTKKKYWLTNCSRRKDMIKIGEYEFCIHVIIIDTMQKWISIVYMYTTYMYILSIHCSYCKWNIFSWWILKIAYLLVGLGGGKQDS